MKDLAKKTKGVTTRHNTIQHEYNTTQHDTTRVQHYTIEITRDNTSATRDNTSKNDKTRVQDDINFILIFLHHHCILRTWYMMF